MSVLKLSDLNIIDLIKKNNMRLKEFINAASSHANKTVIDELSDSAGSLAYKGTVIAGGGAQVQADWNETVDTEPDFIKNKPTIPVVTNDLTNALKTSYDGAVSASHTHANKATVLDLLTASDGSLAFNGTVVGGVDTIAYTDAELDTQIASIWV